MCFIIYTLHKLCQHRQYSSTFHCHVARGSQYHEITEYTLIKTRFLPDSQQDNVVENHPINQQQQQQQDGRPECKKGYPARPVNTFCDACKRSQLKKKVFGDDDPVVASASQTQKFSQPSSSQ